MRITLQKIRDKKSAYDITEAVTSVGWSGSATQASRKLELSLVNAPFDKSFEIPVIEQGDIIRFYFDGKRKFIGRVLRSSGSSSPGDNAYSAYDYMNVLLRSRFSYNFKKRTPESIAKAVIGDAGLKVGALKATGVNIKSWLIDGETGYNIIIGAYYKAYKKKGKKYMPYMDGLKVCVGEKGQSCGIKLKLGANVLRSEFEESAEDIVNKVVIYDENGKRIGAVSEKDSITLYGIYQDIYKKSEGVNATEEAKKMLKGSEKSVKVDIIGDIRAVSGKSIMLYDNITGLWGKFYIDTDSHSFSGGVHTASLTLSFQNFMEGSEEDLKTTYPIAAPEKECYYSSGGEKYHSKSTCGKMNKPIKTTVNEAVKEGKSKCLRCWQ